jgi:hypothetical protein
MTFSRCFSFSALAIAVSLFAITWRAASRFITSGKQASKPSQPSLPTDSEPLTTRGEKLNDLRMSARQWGGWEPQEVLEVEAQTIGENE